MRKPAALRPGDRIAIVAPASPFQPEEFHAGLAELRALGFEPMYDDTLFERHRYLAGTPVQRAEALARAWADPSVAAVMAVRGGYGSVQLLPLLDAHAAAWPPKAFIGYSDLTAFQTWLNQRAGMVTFHGPMLAGRLGAGPVRYDRESFIRTLTDVAAAGPLGAGALDVLVHGEHEGVSAGGNLTQLAASLGTPYAFHPPPGCVLFVEDVGERPYRIDRLWTQLRLAGVLARAGAIVFGTFEECHEPGGGIVLADVLRELTAGFPGPVVFGLPFGHVQGPALTIPLGVRARVTTSPRPTVSIEEAAVA